LAKARNLPIGCRQLLILLTCSSLNFTIQILNMKKWRLMVVFLIISLLLTNVDAEAQCSICAKTASQLGEKPAKALNGAIIYLMSTPLLIIAFIGWRWWKTQKKNEEQQ
jgi:hypothetical protein